MEKEKSKVVKSKSSNSTLRTYNPIDKKSRSNATFQTPTANPTAKRRGVYVERKPTKDSLNGTGMGIGISPLKEPVKAPKRPSRGQKRFLASVLSLLSKSSTGTQYPETEEKKRIIKRATKIMNKAEAKPVITAEPEKRKKKYKSKVLNTSNYPLDTFKVLQSKKNIVQTPSIDFSDDGDDEEVEDIKWAEFLPRLVQPDSEEIQIEKDKKLSHLVKEVAEGRLIKEKRVIIEADEPPTLVSENKKHTTKDPGFYNFFVDLLETTFSVYNVKSQYDYHGAPSAVSSKVAFEMDEVVANKLNVAPELSRPPSVHSRHKEEPNKEELLDYFQLCAPRRSKSPSPQKKKYKSEYFSKYRMPKPQPLLPQSMSLRSPPLFPQAASMTQKKSFYKKNSKQVLLNMLKEQLRMDNQPLEEPQNLFQALKVLAKNKRKTQKTLRFGKTPDELEECSFRSRRLIPSKRSKFKSDSHKILSSPTPSDFKKRQKKSYNSENVSSNHSLEVVNIDYDKYGRLKKRKGTISTSLSPTSYSPSFSPFGSIQDIAYARSYTPVLQQVYMTVKTLRQRQSQNFSNERDEAST